MDYRTIHTSDVALAGTPSRGLFPLQPRLPLQIPTTACMATLGTFGYNLVLRFDPLRRSHAAFINWVEAVESEIRRQLGELPDTHGLQWTTSVKMGSSLYLSLDDKTLLYAPDGASLLEKSPTSLKAAACLVEIAGVWTGPTHAGLRWRVVQVLEQDLPAADWGFEEETELPPLPPPPPPPPAVWAFQLEE